MDNLIDFLSKKGLKLLCKPFMFAQKPFKLSERTFQ